MTPNNEKAGPVSPEEFSNLGIDGDTLVFCKGLTTWTPASQVPDLVPFLPIPQRPPQQNFEQQYPPYQQQQYPAYTPNKKESDNVPGIIGFIFALIAFLFMWIPVLNVVSLLFWLVGLILSIIGMTKRPKGLAIAGLVISIIYFFIILIGIIFVGTILSGYSRFY